jgi:hypothetical protein
MTVLKAAGPSCLPRADSATRPDPPFDKVKRLAARLLANRAEGLRWAPAGLFVLAALLIVVDTVGMVVRTYSPLPYWDQWDSLMDYQVWRHGNFTLAHLFALHNEHRLAVPRLIFWADYALAGGTNKLNLTLIGLIQAAHAALLLSLIGRGRWRAPSTWIVAAAVVALLLSISQWENLTWGFQSQFVGVFALATGAYVLMAKAAGADGWRRSGLFAAALTLLFLATFSMANGLVAASIAIALCLGLRAPWWMAAGTAVYVALAGLFYFHDYHAVNDHSDLAYALAHPWDYVIYFFGFLGNLAGDQLLWQPRGLPPQVWPAATILGALGAVLGAAAVLLVALRKETDRLQAVLVAVMLFVLATALVTAVGRLNFGLWQAYSSRYRTPTAIFWAAQLIFWYRAAWPPLAVARRVATVAAACALAGLILLQQAVKPDLYDKAEGVHRTEGALLSRVADINALNGAFPRGGEVFVRAEILREYDKSIFTEARSDWLGKSLSAVGSMEPNGCKGAFDVVTRSPFGVLDGVRAEGWAWDLAARRAARDVVLANGRDKVVGFGRSGVRRPDVQAALHYPWAVDAGWEAIGRANGATLTAYAVLHDGGLCKVGVQKADALPPPIAIRSLSRTDVAAAIPARATFSGGSGWSAGGVSPTVGPSPAGMRAYGSWSGADGNTGQVGFGPLRADQGAFAMGVVTGPDATGQTILIKDAQTFEVLAALQPNKTDTWTWLRFDLPPAARGRAVLIEALDQGAGWGQWLGVTEPRGLGLATAP